MFVWAAAFWFIYNRITSSVRSTRVNSTGVGPPSSGEHADAGDIDSRAGYTVAEAEAWVAVLAISRATKSDAISSRDAVLELAAQTIRAVSRRLHPEVDEPLWQFTVPEALALLERVSRRLQRYTIENLPLSDQLTVAQILYVYRWRGAFGLAERAYDVWRVVRLANPITAATHELRERLSKKMLQVGREHVMDRLVDAYVKEVGRAAIDLYGGRLRVASMPLETSVSPLSQRDAGEIQRRSLEPLRILVIGRPTVGKTSVVELLRHQTGESNIRRSPTTANIALKLDWPDLDNALIVDTPGWIGSKAARKAMAAQCLEYDMFLCVASARSADRLIEQNLIDLIRECFASVQNRVMPPIVLIVTHASTGETPKGQYAASNDAADLVSAFARELSLDANDIAFVDVGAANTFEYREISATVRAAIPRAEAAKLMRQLAFGRGHKRFRRLISQAAGAGRVIRRSFGPS